MSETIIRHPRRYAEGDRIVVTADASEWDGKTGEVLVANLDGAVVRLDVPVGKTVWIANGDMARYVVR